MTYPPSGSGQSGYGQGDAGQYGQQAAYGQQYGQQAGGYGQQPGDQQYGQQAYGQPQYGESQYGQAQYGQSQYGQQQYAQQQYGQQGYGYQAPKPASQGLPANTPTILAGAIAALGVITLFCGFVDAYKADGGNSAFQVFNSTFSTPYSLVSLAGVLALLTFLVGATKHYVALITGLATVGVLITIFQFATTEPFVEFLDSFGKELGGGTISKAAGAIILLVTSVLVFVAAVLWLLVESGKVKIESAESPATPAATAAQAPAAPAADASSYGYGAYGQQAPPTTAYGQQSQAAYQPSAGYGQPAAQYGQAEQGQAAEQAGSTSSPSNPLPATDADAGATTAFVKPEQRPESGQH
ncbi:MAG: DUF5336 domain-containing protein [Gordonia sp. (in: high G+C Gram-positive bacteria)]|uniref:DUF5336 domain-containing protein n=1 Tax=Gordonia sp. (in: high G+C Gram-positive bacteria) TaxID=84139 RepID=UPI003C77520B